LRAALARAASTTAATANTADINSSRGERDESEHCPVILPSAVTVRAARAVTALRTLACVGTLDHAEDRSLAVAATRSCD
jgi:hypothetical protein